MAGTAVSSDLSPNPPPGAHERGLNALYKISQVLLGGRSQREIFEDVLRLLDAELGMCRGTIMLLSPDGTELLAEVAHDLPFPRQQAVRYQTGEGIIGRVLHTGKPVVVPRISQEPLFLDRLYRRREAGLGDASFICVPIAEGSRVVGTLSADRESPPESGLDEALAEDARLLSIVASMLAQDVTARRAIAAERAQLETENARLQNELHDRFRPENIIGNSNAMHAVYKSIFHVAACDTTVLIRGESGTGKELVAHALHYSSHRAKGPFVRVNCAALNENLFESELFGHEKGAFTGATDTRKGRIEEAQGGTLFLDEIGEFSQAIQIKLLRVLQEREYQRVGGNRTMQADVRIIAATNRDLERAVEQGSFRQDLYYRINVFPIVLPPLRERRDDILLLADYFVEKYAKRLSRDTRRITTPAINMLFAYHWPGNVRELENCIERAVLLSTDGVIHAHHLPPTLQTSDASGTIGTGTLQDRVSLLERDLIIDALKRSRGRVLPAARELGTTERIIRYKIKRLGIDVSRYCPAE